ncbi:MAG TPA: sulfite exporter TauE/SafE family protein [bacterium]|nr:sulfite exporter TauE/SafE family protein [bacterium]
MSRQAVFATIGFLGGVLGGLLGVGGGFVLVPLQVLWAGVPQRNANANSLVAIIPIAVAALPIYYFRKGSPQVDFHLALLLIIGSVVGVFLGARLLRRIPEQPLRIAVAVLLGVVGLKELLFP